MVHALGARVAIPLQLSGARRGERTRSRVAATPRADAAPGPLEAVRRAAAAAAAAAVVASPLTYAPPASAYTPNAAIPELARLSANPIQNARALLRNALPIDNKPIRTIQVKLEDIGEDLRVPGVNFRGVKSNVKGATEAYKKGMKSMESTITGPNRAEALVALEKLGTGLSDFAVIAENEDKQEVPVKQQELLEYVTYIEENMVGEFPYDIPSEFSSMPALKGRATLDIELAFKDNVNYDTGSMTLVLDGYNAPITSGNFMDLVLRKYYDGMDWQRADGFVVQTGKPDGPKTKTGFEVDGKVRTIPLELTTVGAKDKTPIYGLTLEEAGLFREEVVLPFNAFGTLAMARGEFDADSASSQVFFLLKESELTPSGTNILDGRYTVFGYIIDGQELLREVKVGDKITSISIVEGKDALVNGFDPKAAFVPAPTEEAAPEV